MMRHLRPLLESAKRSMLVAVENCTPVTLQLDKQHTTSGMFRTHPPDQIVPGLPHEPKVSVFATESAGAGTDAFVTYTLDIPVDVSRGGSRVSAGVGGQAGVARATVMLRWVNPWMNSAKGKWVEVVTQFDCSPGPVVHWDEPEQRDSSKVTFRIELQEGATQMRYNPDSPSFDPNLKGRFSPLPPLPSPPGEAQPQAAPVEEGVPPGDAEPEPEPEPGSVAFSTDDMFDAPDS